MLGAGRHERGAQRTFARKERTREAAKRHGAPLMCLAFGISAKGMIRM